MRELLRARWLAAAAACMAAATVLAEEDLAPFIAVHRQAGELAAKQAWQDAAARYGRFAADSPADPCAPLALDLQGMILLRELKQIDQARAAFRRASQAPDTPFGREMRRIALGWLARLQMSDIDAALRRYYVDRVAYPDSLDALVQRKLLEPAQLTDPWGKPFVYRAGTLLIAPDVPRQSYALSCSSIQGDSRQLAAVLKESAEFPKRFQLKAIGGTNPLSALVAVAKADKPVHVAEGETIGSARMVLLTREGGVLVDGGFVAVLTK